MATISTQLFFEQLKPVVITAIVKSLCDPNNITQLNNFRSQLTDITSILVKNMPVNNNYISGRFNRSMFNALRNNESLSAVADAAKRTKRNRVAFEDALKRLFVLEHQIMDFLSREATKTADYEVYFTTDATSAKVLHKTISAEELYEQDIFGRTKKGAISNLSISRNLIQNLGGTVEEIDTSEKSQWYQLAVEAIKDMQDQLKQLEALAHKIHLGDERYTRLQDLRKLLGGTFDKSPESYDNEATAKLLDFYVKMTTLKVESSIRIDARGNKYTTNIRPSTNRGHIVEALTRLRHGVASSVGEAFRQSLGSDIWWAQGDVGQTQVKSMLGTSSSVRIASLSSIFELAGYLLDVLNGRNATMNQLQAAVSKTVNNGFGEINYGAADAEVDAMIQRIIESLCATIG